MHKSVIKGIIANSVKKCLLAGLDGFVTFAANKAYTQVIEHFSDRIEPSLKDLDNNIKLRAQSSGVGKAKETNNRESSYGYSNHSSYTSNTRSIFN